MRILQQVQKLKEVQQRGQFSRSVSSAFFDRRIWMNRIESVKQKSILQVAESLGYSFKHISGHVYEHPDHDSFRIFAQTNTFKWFSRDIQGDVIDFVRTITGVSFKEALVFLETGHFEEIKLSDEKLSLFQYRVPEEAFDQARLYLNQVRGLSHETINTFGQQGLLAQGKYQTPSRIESVLVFKSYDHNKQLIGASLQGIVPNPDLYKRGNLKQILKGSHGYAGISFDIGKPKTLVFCESAIDMMSYYQLHQKHLSDVRLVSMEGLKLSVIAYQVLRLAAEEQGNKSFLDTLNPNRLTHYLDTLQKTTTYFKNHDNIITLAVDNDDAGISFCQKLLDKGLPLKMDLPKHILSVDKTDWNDLVKHCDEPSLMNYIHSVKEQVNPYTNRMPGNQVMEL